MSSEDLTETHAVRDAVLRLADARRELVMLIHWDGFTVVEAAEQLGLNPDDTWAILSRQGNAQDRVDRCRPLPKLK